MWHAKEREARQTASNRCTSAIGRSWRLRIVASLSVCMVSCAPAGEQVLGYHLDISNCKVPRLETMFHIVDILAKLGYNHLQMNTEHTFAYPRHEPVWRTASPMTPDEVRSLDAYCAQRGIEFVPNQNSFGHLGKWLRLPEYNHLAESPQGGCHASYRAEPMKFPMSLCPTDPRSIEFVAGLYDSLLPCFRSRQVNVGLDETYELFDVTGCGRSASEIRARGAERVYLDYFKKIYALVKARGCKMMFWGDIILHKPELISEIPEDVTCLNWGYGRNHPFDKEAAQFAAAKRRFLICPGTRTWGTISGCVPEMCQNVDRAVEAGVKHGAAGYLMADWDDGGGVSPWIVSLPPVVYLSLRVRGMVPSHEQFVAEIDRVAGCRCGEALLAYGEIYRASRGRNDNATEMCYALRDGRNYKRAVAKGVTDDTLAAAKAQHEKAKALFVSAGAPQWIQDDFALLDLVCRASEVRAMKPDTVNFRAMFEPEYRRLWLTNSRPGGLEESLNINFGL